MELEELETGDRVLFNDRSLPLEVTDAAGDRVHVKGPHGGEYILFRAEDTGDLLVRSRGSGRRYASYAEDLRKTGEWEREGDTWKHSITGEKVELEQEEHGSWTISTTLEADPEELLDLPRYGYSEKEAAVEAAGELVEEYPEGET